MDQDSGIPVELERRLEGLAGGVDGGGVPGGVDLAVLRHAEGVLKRRRMAVAWGWSWKAGAVAAVLGVAVGLGVMAVGVGPRRGSGGVDMVDALKAAKGGAPAAEVRRIAGAAVRIGQGGGL
ncbi:MAG: hypothetical protein QM783_02770 [Phycisphaerales bacterium]